MKAIQWVINIILILGILYVFVISNDKDEVETQMSNAVTLEKQNTGSAQESYVIRFINSDSLYKHYEMVKDRFDDLENRQLQYSSNLDAKIQSFQQEVQNFQQNASGMSQFEGQMKQKELLQKEQELAELQQELSSKLLSMEQSMQKELRAKVIEKLEEFKLEGVDLILDYSATSSLLVVNDSLDITKEVTEFLNNEYREKTTVE